MEQFYILLLFALFVLAIVDLTVGVSNDAVNFLNSAVGSKAGSLRTVLIVASIGVAVGAVFSSGLMEVARKGIFNPSQFFFDEIMIIFIAVMITDVLLLDLFNSLELPTSTTVSIVFELLGASVAISVLKIIKADDSLSTLSQYINSDKAIEIIMGILLSVVIAFTIGAIVQWISRLVFSFQYEKRMKYVGGIFGGVAITAITYFILIKGIKGVSGIPDSFLVFVEESRVLLLAACFLFFTFISQVIIKYTKYDLLKIIILIGTFALALAFAGNDLVNFIGVPIAAFQSFELWQGAYESTGILPSEFAMNSLSGKVETPTYMLVFAGMVMVVTLWLSKKARSVMYTEINLARSGEGQEKFEPNFLSRFVVRTTVNLTEICSQVIPTSIQEKIGKRFAKPSEKRSRRNDDQPAFDMVRASVNLMVASILISIATSLKLPLSTTYVSFMVAMGTSLSDKAWGRESAVYRVAGVFNVIGGWFVTAMVAFSAAALFATLIFYGEGWAISILLCIALLLLIRSFLVYRKKQKKIASEEKIDRTSLITINEIISDCSENISQVIKRISKIYSDVIDNLGLQDLAKLKKSKKQLKKLETEIEGLKSDIFYFIKSLDESSVEASKFYILTLDSLQDMLQSIGYISKNSFSHVNNNHKNLKFNQIRDLKRIDNKLDELYTRIYKDFDARSFDNIADAIEEKNVLLEHVSSLIQKQIERIRSTETSAKNTKLYFGLLLETKDLITATISLLTLFDEFQQNYNRIKK
ncbi:inorganic phosphate transporter [Galbibacter mesophilus]|uniref:inorganic phosphate transporter n=1 Tax=Galbibacter mesophilus TaxID=379069 RepID=UPI00191FAF43|nr:inorganic phosphate transporter [Galbibacter mesophilus]MCM5661856.1 inorganic phosphate transporter [Galbibacter mesophilus]